MRAASAHHAGHQLVTREAEGFERETANDRMKFFHPRVRARNQEANRMETSPVGFSVISRMSMKYP